MREWGTGESKATIFDSRYRALTIGIILAVTTVAFEGLAITTIAPDLAQHLNGISLYGWIFSAFLLTQILGTMVIGQQIGKIGVYRSFSLSIVIFVAGILVAANSVNMPMLIAGRAFQGFGAGAIVTCVYYSITLSYPDALRTKILAAFSSAYILPALIGPYIAGLIVAAGALSWSTAAWLQSKLDEKDNGRGRKKRVTAGIGLMIVGVSLVIADVGTESGGIGFAVISQIFTGFGIGLANPTTGAIALQHARSGEEGEISAYLQFVDAFCPGVSIGIGGALIAVSEHFGQGIFMGIMLALLTQLLFIILSFLISFRIAKRAD